MTLLCHLCRRAPYDQFFLPELQRHQPEQQQAPLEDALLPLRPATWVSLQRCDTVPVINTCTRYARRMRGCHRCKAVQCAAKAVTQLLFHGVCRDRLCDSLGDPYPDPFQTAYQMTHTAALATADFPLGMRPGIHQNPPTISAAAWLAQVHLFFSDSALLAAVDHNVTWESR